MSENARTHEDKLPYEATAEHLARVEAARIITKHGNDPDRVMKALEADLTEVIHDSLELGAELAEAGFGEISPAELLVAYAAGANENNRGEA